MAERGEGITVPNQRQGHNQQNQQQNQQQQQQNQDPAGQQQHLHKDWSNFKPEFSGKPDEDAEVHLLHSNDWMNAHCFVDGVLNELNSLNSLKFIKTIVSCMEDLLISMKIWRP